MERFVLLFLAAPTILMTLLYARKKWIARRTRKFDEQGFTDPQQLGDLLDEWNRKHRPDLWSRGGDWPTGKNSKSNFSHSAGIAPGALCTPAM